MSDPVRVEPTVRRHAIFWIDKHALMALLGGWGGSGQFLRPVCANLPADAKILDVQYDFHRDAFGVKMEHPSFEVVPEGCELPWLGRLDVEVKTLSKVMREKAERTRMRSEEFARQWEACIPALEGEEPPADEPDATVVRKVAFREFL